MRCLKLLSWKKGDDDDGDSDDAEGDDDDDDDEGCECSNLLSRPGATVIIEALI